MAELNLQFVFLGSLNYPCSGPSFMENYSSDYPYSEHSHRPNLFPGKGNEREWAREKGEREREKEKERERERESKCFSDH